MKLNIKNSSGAIPIDLKKSEREATVLSRLSQKIRRKELSSVNEVKALSRKDPAPLAAGPRTTVKVNISGNLRGMHNHQDSERMRRIRGMRKFYNKAMPVLQCASCAFQSSCPQYKAGYECAFLPFLDSHSVESEKDLISYLKELVGANMRRTHFTLMAETLQGGAPSLETSEALNLAFTQVKSLHELMSESTDVTVETDDSSIIGKLFGGLDKLMGATKEAMMHPIDVPTEASASGDTQSEETSLISPGTNLDLLADYERGEVESVFNK